MGAPIIGRTACPECRFDGAHVKRSEKCIYRYCPECSAMYHAKTARQQADLLAKMRPAEPLGVPTPTPGKPAAELEQPAPTPTPGKAAKLPTPSPTKTSPPKPPAAAPGRRSALFGF